MDGELILQTRDIRRSTVRETPEPDAPREARPTHVAIVIPVYKDWPSLAQLLQAIDDCAQGEDLVLSLVVVNDAPANTAAIVRQADWRSIHHLEVLHLTRNLGHQRAIAVGLAHVDAAIRCDCVVVMDADGEDRPSDMIRLVRHHRTDPAAIVVAERRKRSEGLVFRSSYRLYKGMFRLLTGQSVDFGNFCLIPRLLLVHLVSMSEVWSNFPAGIIQSRLPVHHLPTERGRRYQGRSTMNFIALIMHGLGAISVFSEAVFIRVTLLSFAFLLMTGIAIVTVLMLKLTGHATPGWASNLAVSLSILAVQMVMLSIVAAFMVLNSRTSATVIPRLSYRNFVLRREVMWTETVAASQRAIA